MLYKFLLLSLSLFIFLGCSNAHTKITNKKISYPSWYINPPQNNDYYTYGVGIGESNKEATMEALNQAISSLTVNISSVYKSNIEYSKDNSVERINKSIKSVINSELEKISINNYQIVEQKKVSYSNYVSLIKIDNKKLYVFFKNKIDNIKKEMLLEFSSTSNDFEKLNIYKKYIKKYNNYKKYIYVMKTLNTLYDSTSYFKQLNKINRDYLKYKNKIMFNVKSNDKNVKNIVVNNLLKSGLKINNKNYKYLILINEEIINNMARGIYISTLNIHINVVDTNNNKIIGKNITVKGYSSQNYKLSQEKSYKILDKKLMKNNIFHLLLKN